MPYRATIPNTIFGDFGRLIGIYRAIRQFYNASDLQSVSAVGARGKAASKFRTVYGGSVLSIISWQVFRRGVSTRDAALVRGI